MKHTWRELVGYEMEDQGDSWDNVVATVLGDPDTRESDEHEWVADLDAEFDAGFGQHNGCPFTIWTHLRVYFPAVYDGREWVASVSRDPNGEATLHVGGE